jgi:hypothetical protein
MITDNEVGVEPPAQLAVEGLGPFHIRDGDGDDFELEINWPRIWGKRGFIAYLGHGGHGGLS